MRITLATWFCACFVVSHLVTAGSCLADDGEVRPVLVCPRVKTPPVIDGLVHRAEWASAGYATNFMTPTGRSAASQETEVYTCRDSENLYVAFICHDPEAARLRSRIRARDDNVYNDDCVELFIDPGLTRKHFYQLLVNPLGTLQDIRFAEWLQSDWNVDAHVAATRDADFWSVEVAIPLDQIELEEFAPGQRVGVNFTRTLHRLNEYSCWSPTGSGSFHVPGRFGDMILADRPGIGVRVGDWSTTTGAVQVAVGDAVRRQARVEIVTESKEGEARRSVHEIAPEGLDKPLRLSYTLPPSWHDYRARVEVYDASDGAILYRSSEVALAGSTDAKLAQARDRIERLEADIRLLKSGGADAGYMVTAIDPFSLPKPSALPEGAVGRGLDATATPGEYEPASFLIYTTVDLRDVRITVDGDLVRDTDGARGIPSDNIDIRLVKWWIQGGRDSGYDAPLLVPELLLKNDAPFGVDEDRKHNVLRFEGLPVDGPRLQPFNLPAYRNKQVWLTVHVPPSTAAGVYEGTLRVAAANAPPTRVPIRVRVLPFQLVETRKLFSIYYYNPTDADGRVDWDMLDRELADMKAHGFNSAAILSYDSGFQESGDSGEPIDLERLSRQVASRTRAGMRGPVILGFQTHKPPFPTTLYRGPWRDDHAADPAEVRKLTRIITTINAWAEANGSPPIYYYGIDEPNFDYTGRALSRCARLFEVIRGAGGRTTTALDVVSTLRLGELIDMPIYNAHAVYPLLDRESPKASGNGVELMYWHPLESPVHDRFHFGVMPWKAGLDGVCPYAYRHVYKGGAYYDESLGMPGGTHSRVNRNIMYTYPSQTGPIPTIQWEAAREGIDDLRYLETLAEWIDRAKLHPNHADLHEEIRLAEEILGLPQIGEESYASQLEELSPAFFAELRQNVVDRIIALRSAMTRPDPS